MQIHIVNGDIHLIDLRTRMPFKYGIATMTSTPHAFIRVRLEVAGKPAVGISADHLPPKWFTKDPAKPIAGEVAEMLTVIEQALQASAGLRAESPFGAWRQLYDQQASWGKAQGFPPLLAHFGTALVERAMLDAVCRAAGRPFAQLLRSNQLGVRLSDVHSALGKQTPAELLPKEPLREIIVRHTIGLADPLTDADIAAHERLDDGLPQSLAASIRAYGLRHFKIKVCGDVGRDLERLHRVAAVIEMNAGADYAFSLDGNEQYQSLAEFRRLWDEVTRSSKLTRFLSHLLFVEQPLHRQVALDPAAVGALRDWAGAPPMIIDESDATLESLPQALSLGYAGTSHKNCKGVFKGLANACLLTHLQRQQSARKFVMSGEDLCNIGPVALLQDLAVCAAFGIASVERNGHHYFAGLSMFPKEVRQQVLDAHGDLYGAGPQGWPRLTIKDGVVGLDSVNKAMFGVGFQLNVERFMPVSTWRKQTLG